MAQFDLFKLPDDHGYVVEVQSNPTSARIRTGIVVPLVPLETQGTPITDNNPIVQIEGRDYVFLAQSIATVTVPEMGPRIASLAARHGAAFAHALKVLLIGF